jgi:hypothetical protein
VEEYFPPGPSLDVVPNDEPLLKAWSAMAEWMARGRERFEAPVATDAAEGKQIWPG